MNIPITLKFAVRSNSKIINFATGEEKITTWVAMVLDSQRLLGYDQFYAFGITERDAIENLRSDLSEVIGDGRSFFLESDDSQ